MAPTYPLDGLPAAPRPWAMLAVAACLAIVFLVVTGWVFDDTGAVAAGAAEFDRAIEQALQRHRAPALTGRVIEVSALGSAPVLIVLGLLAYSVILAARDRLAFLHLTVALVGSGVLSRLLQHVFDRERPDTLLSFIVVTKGSYPSAHMFGAAASYATFAFLYARYARRPGADIACYVAAGMLVLLIGATRVYLGAHFATDVIAGISAGAAWAFLVAAVFSVWYGKPASRA